MAGWLSMPCQVWPGDSSAAHRSTPHIADPTAIIGFCLRMQQPATALQVPAHQNNSYLRCC